MKTIYSIFYDGEFYEDNSGTGRKVRAYKTVGMANGVMKQVINRKPHLDPKKFEVVEFTKKIKMFNEKNTRKILLVVFLFSFGCFLAS